MNLALLWRLDSAADAAVQAHGSRIHLCFDWLALERLRAAGAPAEFIDDLLTWEDRERIEDAAAGLVRRVVSDPHVIGERAAGIQVAPAAEYQLRMELTNLLRCHAAVERLAESRPIDGVGEFGRCPSTALFGARAALTHPDEHPIRVCAPESWVPVHPGPATFPRGLSRALWRANVSLGSARDVRILAVAGARVPDALCALSRTALRRVALAVASFPGLAAGDAVRVALRARVPFFALGGSRDQALRPAPRVGELVPESPQLDAAARLTARAVLARAVANVSGAARAISRLDRFVGCRALILPNTSAGASRLLVAWARERGVRCAVVQHGIYGFRDWDTGDRLADVILGWGPRVADQIAAGPEPHPRVVPVGSPGLQRRPRDARDPVRRALVATTNAPIGSALGMHGLPEEYLATIAPGLRRLLAGDVALKLRHHPAEETWRYEQLLRQHNLPIPISNEGSIAEVVSRADLVVSSASSVAFEAGALDVPVLMWLGGAPAEIRGRHFLPPLRDKLAGTFTSEGEFTALAEALVDGRDGTLSAARRLATHLAGFTMPFDPARMQEALMDLATSG